MDTNETLSSKEDHPTEQQDRAALSLSPISQSLTDRMRRLAATAWTLEQDDEMSDTKRQQIEKLLATLQLVVEDDHSRQSQDLQMEKTAQTIPQNAVEEQESSVDETENHDGWVSGSDLLQVHDNLAEIVSSMSLRHQEQRHLHQLTAIKLEAIAQRCLFQEQQMQDLWKEVKNLRVENQTIGQENDGLRRTITELESEASKNEVAVSAMTSAVAGLEGWIEDTDRASANHSAVTTPTRGHRQRRAVTRGKGRFRGRYFVDDDHDGYFTGTPDTRDLQDGVRAWIRGFRDVEDACSSPVPARLKESYRGSIPGDGDEWGDFESPAPTPS